GVDAPRSRLVIQVYAIGGKCILLLLLAAILLLFSGALLVLHAARRPALGGARALRNAVGDVVDRVIAGHLLFLQEIRSVALALCEYCNKHIGPRHFFPAGRLNVDDGALNDPLEAGSRLGIFVVA